MRKSPTGQELKFRQLQTFALQDKPLTTSEVGLILKVSNQSVVNGMESGHIKGMWKIPGSHFRKMPPSALRRFMHETNHPNTDVIDPVTIELTRNTHNQMNDTIQCPDGFSLGMTLVRRPAREILIHTNALPEAGIATVVQQIKQCFAEAGIPPPPIRIIDNNTELSLENIATE